MFFFSPYIHVLPIYRLRTLSYLQKYVSSEIGLLIYKSMILSLFEYANLTFTLIPVKYRNKMQRLQDRALKIIYFHERYIPIPDLHIKAKLLTLERRAEAQLLCLMFKRSNDQEKYPLVRPIRFTRANEKLKFYIPRPKKRKIQVFSSLSRGAAMGPALC